MDLYPFFLRLLSFFRSSSRFCVYLLTMVLLVLSISLVESSGGDWNLSSLGCLVIGAIILMVAWTRRARLEASGSGSLIDILLGLSIVVIYGFGVISFSYGFPFLPTARISVPTSSFNFTVMDMSFVLLGLSLAVWGRKSLISYLPVFLVPFSWALANRLYLSPLFDQAMSRYLVPSELAFIAFLVRILGFQAQVEGSLITVAYGVRNVSFVMAPPCMGLEGVIAFSYASLFVVWIYSASLKLKLVWSSIGLIGTVLTNVIRVTVVSLAALLSGYNVAMLIHERFGDLLFLAWVSVFALAASRRLSPP